MTRFWKYMGLVLALTLLGALIAGAGAQVDAAPLTLDTPATATLTEDSHYAYFSFTPAETGIYKFYSTSNEDTYGYLYDADMNQIAENDDGGEYSNFEIDALLTAGTPYYFGARYYNESNTGSFPVVLTRPAFAALPDGSADLKVSYNGDATLKVFAYSAEDPLTYQWYAVDENGNNNPIEGATADTYFVHNVTRRCRYFCDVNSEESVYFNVSVDNQLTAEASTGVDLTVLYGGDAEMAVTASCLAGPQGLHYQWYAWVYHEDTNSTTKEAIEGATSASYTARNIMRYTDYVCVVSDDYDNGVEVNIHVHIDTQFTAQQVGDADRYVEPGASETLQVNASSLAGAQSLTYQWYVGVKNESGDYSYSIIEGATTDTYTVQNVTGYTPVYCEVRDGGNTSTNVYFSIHIENRLTVEEDGETDLKLAPGADATMKVNASCLAGPDGLHYQWSVQTYDSANDSWNSYTEIVGATTDTYVLQNASMRATYRCTVTDDYDSSRSVYFNVYIQNHLRATRVGYEDEDEDDSIYVEPNQDVTLQVRATCDAGDLHYQWYELEDYDYRTIEGAITDTYVIQNITGSHTLRCAVWDDYGSRHTAWFYLYIENRFEADAASATAFNLQPGGSAAMAVEASCNSGELHYQWFERTYPNGYNNDGGFTDTAIEGATGKTYTAQNVTRYSEYRCAVSDVYGNDENILFSVGIDNGLTARLANGNENDRITVLGGEDAVVRIDASCNTGSLHYAWNFDNYCRYETSEGGAVCTIEDFGSWNEGWCFVTDDYGNPEEVWFTIDRDNGLTIDNYDRDLFVPYGQTATLSVSAYCDEGDLTYQWYKRIFNEDDEEYRSDEIEGATGTTLTTDAVTGYQEYYCEVRDAYGYDYADFYVHVQNGFTVSPSDNRTIEVNLEEGQTSVDLVVTASSDTGDISYQWYTSERIYVAEEGGYYYDDRMIEGANTGTYTATPTMADQEYWCKVADSYGSKKTVWFSVSPYNDFWIEPATSQMFTIVPGETVTMAIETHGDAEGAEYQWYRNNSRIKGATGTEYTTPALTSDGIYTCRVRDHYLQSYRVTFAVRVETEGTALALDQPVDVRLKAGEMKMYVFTPDETATYTIESSGKHADTYVHLYDADYEELDSDDDGGSNYNFRLRRTLEAGRTYYYCVRTYNGDKSAEFTVLLTKGGTAALAYKEFAMALRPGQVVSLPGMLEIIEHEEGADYDLLSVVSDNGSVVSVSGAILTASAAGSATVTATYSVQDEIQYNVVYRVTVADGSALVMPANLAEIQEQAFAGDTSIQYVELGNTARVRKDAFNGSGLKQLVVSSRQTILSVSALRGTQNVTILCPRNSRAARFAKRYGFAYAYLD